MSKKNIQIIVIVICFGLAGFVLYNGFKGSGSSESSNVPAVSDSTMGGAAGDAVILPNGKKLNFSKAIDAKRFQYDLYQYPHLDPNAEIGIDENKLIPVVSQ